MPFHYCIYLQVAAQQGKYLAKVMNSHTDYFAHRAGEKGEQNQGLELELEGKVELPEFKYQHLGSMASVGDWKGVIDTPNIC